MTLFTISQDYTVHVKPCFLYMAYSQEDERLYCSDLIRQWVADGLVNSDKVKDMEQVALECLNDLVNRNLIMAWS